VRRRDALRLVAAGALGASVMRPQPRRPNLLLILADDLGWGDVGFNGRRDWPTPNLDRLARQGTVFTRWYSAATVCAPSRASLLTGKYTIHSGVKSNGDDLPRSEITFAEALKPLGYTTALIGKWHHGALPDGSFTHPLDQGFDSTFGFLDARHAWEHFPKTLWRGRQEETVSGFTADIFSEEAGRFIRDNRSRPFCLYLAYNEPHFHIEAPPDAVARFKGKFSEHDRNNPLRATYAAMIHRLDAGIGRVLKALDETGLTNDTLVVFSSDNGATFESGSKGVASFHDSNRPFRGQKRSLEEGGIREPGVVRWPGRVPAGRRFEEPVHMIDVMPSLVAAAGGAVDPAWKVDGLNLLDVWTGKAKLPERTLFWEWTSEGYDMYAAARGDFKLLRINGADFLYNIRLDPGERRTLAAEQPEIWKRLRSELEEWKRSESRL
jgi:arylsulfatase A-like enzyme